MDRNLQTKIDTAIAMRKSGKFPEAKEITTQVLGECPKNDFNSRGLCYSLLGQLERDCKNYDGAVDYYNQALHQFTMCRSNFKIAHTIRHIADIQRHQKKFGQSAKNYEEAIIVYASSPSTNLLDFANALRGYALLMEDMGDPEKARKFWNDAKSCYENAKVQSGIDECLKRLGDL